MDKNELIITALQQRISELTGQYEISHAILRAEYTIAVEQSKQYLEELEKYKKEEELRSSNEENLQNIIVNLKKENEKLKYENSKKSAKETKDKRIQNS